MTYTFEDLPSANHGYRAQKVMLNGQQVAVLVHLDYNNNPHKANLDWRLFRLADDKQVHPWGIHTTQSLEQAQRKIKDIDPAVFAEDVERVWAVAVHTSYGQRFFAKHDRDGYLVVGELELKSRDATKKIFDGLIQDPTQAYLPYGNKVTRIEMVNLFDANAETIRHDFVLIE